MIEELQSKLRTAQQQVAEYERDKQIAREIQQEANKYLNLNNLKIKIAQITERFNAIYHNNQDAVIAQLTQEANELRAQLSLPHYRFRKSHLQLTR